MGFGADAWDRLFGSPRPAELHPFREFRSGAREAIATPGDMLLHIRAKRMDLCFELDDSVKPTSAHSALTTIVENGEERKILRDNMPFGRPGHGEFGTYFIGYSRSPRTIEQMLENMFIGRPPGNYDRILDFSHALTGNLFFVPSATFLDAVSGSDAAATDPVKTVVPESAIARDDSRKSVSNNDGSLNIGSLKGDLHRE